jgi:hypothetical protein
MLPRAGLETARRAHRKTQPSESANDSEPEARGVVLRLPVKTGDCAQAGHTDLRATMQAVLESAARDGPGSPRVLAGLHQLRALAAAG